MMTSCRRTDRPESLKIAIFGASGDIGRRLVAESLDRGHQVTAVSRRHPETELHDHRVKTLICDIEQESDVSAITRSHDIVISTLRPRDGEEAKLLEITARVVHPAIQTGTRFIVIGGAARLKLPDAPQHTVLTAPGFLPEAYVAIARASQEQYEWVRPRLGMLGTYLSPPAAIAAGQRTGMYRSGLDTLLLDSQGESKISIEDFAVAVLDEAQQPTHTGTPFTVAY